MQRCRSTRLISVALARLPHLLRELWGGTSNVGREQILETCDVTSGETRADQSQPAQAGTAPANLGLRDMFPRPPPQCLRLSGARTKEFARCSTCVVGHLYGRAI